jgi:hypothetical protein
LQFLTFLVTRTSCYLKLALPSGFKRKFWRTYI